MSPLRRIEVKESVDSLLPQPSRNRVLEKRQAFAGDRGYPHRAPRTFPVIRDARLAVQQIDLIVHADLRNLVGVELFEHGVHLPHTLPAIRVAGIDQVQDKVRLARFLQR